MHPKFLLSITTGLLVSLAIATASPAMPAHSDSEPATEFQRIEQPLALKLAIALGGAGLVGLELWWFLFSQPRSASPDQQPQE
mgnify:CR=1 FL=1